MYTDADIARLRLLRVAVEHGHTSAASLASPDVELRHVAATAGASVVSGVAPGAPRAPPVSTAAALPGRRAIRS
jgi:hypothetical protein